MKRDRLKRKELMITKITLIQSSMKILLPDWSLYESLPDFDSNDSLSLSTRVWRNPYAHTGSTHSQSNCFICLCCQSAVTNGAIPSFTQPLT